MIVTCYKCPASTERPMNFNNEIEFILCSQCENNYKLYSKTYCIKQLSLTNNDLSSIKYKHNPKHKFFLEQDIKEIIKNKYGNGLEELQLKRKLRRLTNKRIKQNKRYDLLKEKLMENNLEHRRVGDCFTFVKYGYPSIDNVIKNEKERKDEIQKRRDILNNELKKYKLEIDNNYRSACYDYIYNITNKTIADTIDDTKINQFLSNNSTYSKLSQIYPKDIAAKIVLKSYFNNDK